ncbi:MAG: LytTR family DNA-binding domain-containing protein [Defluviitaleaceae bacterium]|nr:LytTR family DNA-binding domain-containing protein [Defluviitaleaceae bacterium]MCL2274028.1 LytTR family DNA-binding domain-containing protein [Defluviitaleaceae bacterium]MCL2274071.1 LytTR family DNA-binding domain-containing protein [Defluviitaleaceae bacterium]
MLHITICDDEKPQADYIRTLVSTWARAESLAVEIRDFNSAEAFLFAYEDDKNVDILLLDIQMGGETGMDLARRLRGENYSGQIIFVTGYPDFAAEGYDVGALHYLMKPIKEEKLVETLNIAVSKLRQASRALIFPKPRGTVKVTADEIIWVEMLSRLCILNLTTGIEEIRMSIREMEMMLGEGFFKCHRSYIVNMKYVRRVTKIAMVLEDKRELPLARGLYDAANQAFIKYH